MGRRQSERGKPPSCHPDRPYFAAGLCSQCYQAGRARADRERTRQQNRRYARKNAHKTREFQRRYAYGLEPSQYAAMVSAQSGKCAICAKERFLCVDHCHETDQVRALLCKGCNILVGLCETDPTYLMRLTEYLRVCDQWRSVETGFKKAVNRCLSGEDISVVARELQVKKAKLRKRIEEKRKLTGSSK